MTIANVNGQQIAYSDSGGDGPALLFSHGFLMDRTMFDAQVAALKDKYRCVCWDERGFGETPATASFSYWDSADDAIALMDHLGIDEAVLLGMSQGGFLSLRAALRYPDRVRAIVLIDSGTHVDPPEVLEGYGTLIDRWRSDESLDEVAGIIASIIINDPVHSPIWIDKWKTRDRETIVLPAETLLTRDDIADRVGEIRCPVLIIHGEEDNAIPIATAEELAGELPDCRGFVRIPGAAHAPNMTHPEPVNQAIAQFLDTIG
ncbi:MAG: alpha/beta hydrolase [Pseudomonadales bacterium]|nr:alpha/beta hydrolase [Pseudomonadales bacterium]